MAVGANPGAGLIPVLPVPRRRDFGPSIFGKANTVAQVTAVAVVLLHQLTTAKWVVILRLVALDATIGLTILSGLHYAWIAAHRSSAHADGSSPS